MVRSLGRAGYLVAAVVVASHTATAGPECRCRLFGERVAIGTVTCIKGKLMQCLMFQNTPSWKLVGDICPVAKQNFTPRIESAKPADLSSLS